MSSKFNMDYLCMDGYTKLVYNFDEFLDKLILWIKENNLTRTNAATKLVVSHTLLRFWFNGSSINTSNNTFEVSFSLVYASGILKAFSFISVRQACDNNTVVNNLYLPIIAIIKKIDDQSR